MSSYLSGLNPSQKKAVMHTNGPLLVLAGAGSGKTRVLAVRIARLVKEKICPPSGILAVTFTNKASREMKDRIAKLTSPKAADAMTVCTFHSLGVRILREDGERLGLRGHFSILGDHERVSTIKSVLRTTGRAAKDEDHEQLAVAISLAKNGGLDIDAQEHEETLGIKGKKVFKAYTSMMLKRQAVDFDDLLLLPLRLLEQHPDVLEKYRKRFRFVSIDEFQDTNAVQMRLAQLLAAPKNNIMAVGDDDQGIYSWRGAVLENILSYPQRFEGCTTVILDQNYRSTRQILEGAHAVVSKNRMRTPKKLVAVVGDGEPIMHYKADDEEEEAEWIAARIREHVEQNLFACRDHALLLRTNALMRRFEEAFRRNKVPYRTIGASSFFDRKEIRDVVAYMRFFANHDDELSLERMLKVPNKGIVKTSIEALDQLAATRKISLWKAIEHCDDIDGLKDEQKVRVGEFRDFCRRHAEIIEKEPLGTAFRQVLEACGYMEHMRNAAGLGDKEKDRLENVEEMLRGLESFQSRGEKTGKNRLADYLHELTLLSSEEDEDSQKSGRNAVSIMTLHKAKGLEFPVVFLAALDDSVIPSPRTVQEGKIDEERRLFYVGMTRARKRLYLTFPATKALRGKMLKVTPSRFIWEIPEEFLDGKIGEKSGIDREEFLEGFFRQMQEQLGGAQDEDLS
jgi:DNA helicase II / ATP-dependent DNA helicase PcrA